MIRKTFLLFAPLLLGCTSHPRVMPLNAINEPVFHESQYLALGIGGGPLWLHDGGSPQNPSVPSTGLERSLYVNPAFTWDINVTPWASFPLWPGYWTFLLTGSQYQDGNPGLLKIHKLDLTLSGGVSSLFHDSEDGWVITTRGEIQGKYLFSERVFATAGMSTQSDLELKNAMDAVYAGLGIQWLPASSVFFSYNGSRFETSENNYAQQYQTPYYSGDYLSRFNISFPTYFRHGRHVLTPEAEYGVRNAEWADTWYFLVGANYRFVFK